MESADPRRDFRPFRFSQWPIDPSEIFRTGTSSFAFVNLKPVVPGHVLVSPKRVVSRVAGLTDAELADLWRVAREVGRVVETHHGASSLTFAIQDGPEAGQTVPHVHIHIMPRKSGDFQPNDKVYEAMDRGEADEAGARATTRGEGSMASSTSPTPSASTGNGLPRVDEEERQPRGPAEMAAEAALYRHLFDLCDSASPGPHVPSPDGGGGTAAHPSSVDSARVASASGGHSASSVHEVVASSGHRTGGRLLGGLSNVEWLT